MLATPEGPAGPAAAAAAVPSWGLGDVAITLGLTIALGSVAVVVAQVLAPASSSGPVRAWASVALLVVPWIALAGWPLLAARRKGNGPRLDYGLTLTMAHAVIGVVGGICGLVAALAVGAAQQALTHTTLSSAVGDLASSTTSASAPAVAVLALCIAFGAPIVEELAFRGLTYGALLKRGVPQGWSVLAVTVAFALFHFEPARILVLLTLGTSLALVRMWTGSTAASMLAHMSINIPGAIFVLGLIKH